MSITDLILADCGKDVAKLHDAYAAEMAKPAPQRHQSLIAQLSQRLGWPMPDTPESVVLWGAGRPGNPVGRVLAREEARPERYQRPELIAELRRRAEALGAAANSFAVPKGEVLQ